MIEEYGTHDQLMHRNGYYKQTYNQQLIKKEISE
jgi:ABC-type multidrug transport system fused ATPase/permease subunit